MFWLIIVFNTMKVAASFKWDLEKSKTKLLFFLTLSTCLIIAAQ